MSVRSRLRQLLEWLFFQPAQPVLAAALRIIVAVACMRVLFGPSWNGSPSRWDLQMRSLADRDPASWDPTSYLQLLMPSAPDLGLVTMLAVAASISAYLTLVGLGTRYATIVLAATMLVLLAMTNSWGKVNHGYQMLGIALLVLPWARSGDALSLDALIRRMRGRARPGPSWRYRWPTVIVQFGFATMFFFAGLSKLIESGLAWAFSENMRNMLVAQNGIWRDWDTAHVIVRVAVEHPLLWQSMAAGALAAELAFIAVPFVRDQPWLRRLGLVTGIGLVMGFWLLMQLPNPVLLILLAVFIDWEGVADRIGRLTHRTPARHGTVQRSLAPRDAHTAAPIA